MSDDRTTIGQRLLDLKSRSGLTLEAIAERAGYRGRSSVQKAFNAAFDADYLHPSTAMRLMHALVGLGDPPITEEDFAFSSNFLVSREDDVERIRQQDEIFLSKLVRKDNFLKLPNGRVIDVFQLKPSKLFFAKPAELLIRSIVALEINVSVMYPRFKLGEVAIFDVSRTAKQGEDALCVFNELGDENVLGTFGFVEQLSEEAVILRQYAVSELCLVPRELVVDMFPVVPLSQMLPIRRRSGNG